MALSKQDQAFYEEKLNYKSIGYLFGSTTILGAIIWGSVVGLVKAAGLSYVELTAQAEKQAAQVLWDAIRRQEG